MKKVKVVIGANYGDEGKGLMTRHFVMESQKRDENPVVILHNGTAQRGHTVDYNPKFRHVYHHFNSGTADGALTFFAETFFVHPMEFRREYEELESVGIHPFCICDPNAKIITPFDMLTDHATEDNIARINGEREFGSCGFGSWCAIEDRYPMKRTAYTVEDFQDALLYEEFKIGATTDYKAMLFDFYLEQIWKDCLVILTNRKVDLEGTKYEQFLKNREIIKNNFKEDFKFFLNHVQVIPFKSLWNNYNFNSFIFENAQGLGLDKDVKSDWHTTSKTGLYNPANMLKDKTDFDAEVCYVTRSYLTRHGIGPLEEAVQKRDINADMVDKTNVPNEFQGSLRYGYYDSKEQSARIAEDWSTVAQNSNFHKTMAITHCNEFNCEEKAEYMSNNPYSAEENK